MVNRSYADPGRTFVLDATSGALLQTVEGVWQVEVARDESRVYLQGQGDVQGTAMVQVWDPRTLTTIATVTTDRFIDVIGGLPGSRLVMIAPPDAPTNLRAEVVDGGIRLAWNPPPDVGDYEIAAGSEPGVYNIGTVRTGAARRTCASATFRPARITCVCAPSTSWAPRTPQSSVLTCHE